MSRKFVAYIVISVILTLFIFIMNINLPIDTKSKGYENIIKSNVANYIRHKPLIFKSSQVDIKYIDSFLTLNNRTYVFYIFTQDGTIDNKNLDGLKENICEIVEYYGFNEIKSTILKKYFLGEGTFTNSVNNNEVENISIGGYGDYRYGLIYNKAIESIEFYINNKICGEYFVYDRPYYLIDISDSENKAVKIKCFSKKRELIYETIF